jgi:hypothetical protein
MVKNKGKRRSRKRGRPIIAIFLAVVAIILALAIYVHYALQSKVTVSAIFTKLYKAELQSGVPLDIARAVPHALVVEVTNTKANNSGVSTLTVPLYLGTSTYKNVSISTGEWSEVWRLLQVRLGLAGSATLKAIVVGEARNKDFWSNVFSNNTVVVVFGLTTCPHCHAMREFFKESFSDRAYFLWMDKDWVDKD